MALARKYLPLNRHLEALDPGVGSISITFSELETILGTPLPLSAWLAHYWAGSSVARYNWERSGFAAKLDRLGRLVVFTRRPQRII